ncbi:hypothetical protein D3C84_937850 [compost metagenome]
MPWNFPGSRISVSSFSGTSILNEFGIVMVDSAPTGSSAGVSAGFGSGALDGFVASFKSAISFASAASISGPTS